MAKLLRNPAFAPFIVGASLSSLGDKALWLALVVYMKDLTGSTALAANSMVLLALGTLLAPLIVPMVDRVESIRVMAVGSYVGAAILIPLFWVNSTPRSWIVFLVMFAYGLIMAVLDATSQMSLREVIGAEQVGAANGVLQGLVQGQRVLAPALGVAVLLGGGLHGVIIADGLTFLAAGACWWNLSRTRTLHAPPDNDRGWIESVGQGFLLIARTSILRQTTCLASVAAAVSGAYQALNLAAVVQGMGRPAAWVGLLACCTGAAGVLGSLWVGPRVRPLGPRLLSSVGLAGMLLGSLCYASRELAVVVLGALLTGLCTPLVLVSAITIRQLSAPKELLGRIAAADNAVVMGANMAGVLAASFMVEHYTYQTAAVAQALFLACATGAACVLLPRRSLLNRRTPYEVGDQSG